MCGFEKYISQYIDDRLSDKNKTKFEKHLDNCAICQKQLRLSEMIAKSCNSMEQARLPEDFNCSLKARLSDIKPPSRPIMINWRACSLLTAVLLIMLVVKSDFLMVFNIVKNMPSTQYNYHYEPLEDITNESVRVEQSQEDDVQQQHTEQVTDINQHQTEKESDNPVSTNETGRMSSYSSSARKNFSTTPSAQNTLDEATNNQGSENFQAQNNVAEQPIEKSEQNKRDTARQQQDLSGATASVSPELFEFLGGSDTEQHTSIATTPSMPTTTPPAPALTTAPPVPATTTTAPKASPSSTASKPVSSPAPAPTSAPPVSTPAEADGSGDNVQYKNRPAFTASSLAPDNDHVGTDRANSAKDSVNGLNSGGNRPSGGGGGGSTQSSGGSSTSSSGGGSGSGSNLSTFADLPESSTEQSFTVYSITLSSENAETLSSQISENFDNLTVSTESGNKIIKCDIETYNKIIQYVQSNHADVKTEKQQAYTTNSVNEKCTIIFK